MAPYPPALLVTFTAFNFGAVYTAQVASYGKLVLRFSISYTTMACWRPQTIKLLKQSAIFWKCNLLSSGVNWPNGKPVEAATKLMLMLAQVNAFHSGHYQTPIKHWKRASRLLYVSIAVLWELCLQKIDKNRAVSACGNKFSNKSNKVVNSKFNFGVCVRFS